MKKLLITAFLTCIYSVTSYAGVNVGISGQAGLFVATGNEKHSDATDSAPAGSYKPSDTEIGEVGYASVFVEAMIQDRFMIGVDYVPSALSTETEDNDPNPVFTP